MTGLWRLQLTATIVSAVALFATYMFQSYWAWAPIFIASALWSWYGRKRGWAFAATLSTAIFVFGTVFGVWVGIKAPYCLLALIAALCAWDLDGLESRLKSAADGPTTPLLVKRHLNKLARVMGIGVVTAGIVLSIELRLDFWIVFSLGLVMALGLSRVFLLTRRLSSDECDIASM